MAKVTSRVVTRWYVYGRGYNSRIEAYMRIAARWADQEATRYAQLRLDPNLPYGDRSVEERRRLENEWHVQHAPASPDCVCSFCIRARSQAAGRTPFSGFANMRGCFFARRRWLRKIAQEIIDGIRDADGNVIRALPSRSEESSDARL